jgi:GTPase SAR1 family protein
MSSTAFASASPLEGQNPNQITKMLEDFKSIKLNHHRFMRVMKKLMFYTSDPFDPSIILLMGTTGVGKTTIVNQFCREFSDDWDKRLKNETDEIVRAKMFSSIPISYMVSPTAESGNFSNRSFYVSLLSPLGEWGINRKTSYKPKILERAHRARVDDLHEASINSLNHRNTQICFVDEAQHITSSNSNRRNREILDGIKTLSDETETTFVFIGTEELRKFAHLTGQLSRRVILIKFPSYSDSTEDLFHFRSIVKSMGSKMPFCEPQDLSPYYDLLYEKSLGLIGVLTETLYNAVKYALYQGFDRITPDCIQFGLKDEESLKSIRRDQDPTYYLGDFGSDDRSNNSRRGKNSRRKKPGRRNPTRDKTGSELLNSSLDSNKNEAEEESSDE